MITVSTWENSYSCVVLMDYTSYNSWGSGNSGKYYNAPMELAAESVCNSTYFITIIRITFGSIKSIPDMIGRYDYNFSSKKLKFHFYTQHIVP